MLPAGKTASWHDTLSRLSAAVVVVAQFLPAACSGPQPQVNRRQVAINRRPAGCQDDAERGTQAGHQPPGLTVAGAAHPDRGERRFRPAPAQIDNGDEARYSDKSGSYTKGVLQAGIGLVRPRQRTRRSGPRSASGAPARFEKIILGGPRTLNGPQAGLAFYLDTPWTAASTLVPPAPALASEAYAARTDRAVLGVAAARRARSAAMSGSSVATRAAAELSSPAGLCRAPGPRTGQVVPRLLFRGGFAGEEPGTLPVPVPAHADRAGVAAGHPAVRHQPGGHRLHDPAGRIPGRAEQQAHREEHSPRPGARHLHDGRGLAAFTHDDVLFQAYFMAYLVLSSVNGALPPPLNMGNPYVGSKTQNGFGTFGPPDSRIDAGRGGGRGDPRGVVSEMAGASPPPPGIRRRDGVSQQDGPGRHGSRAT